MAKSDAVANDEIPFRESVDDIGLDIIPDAALLVDTEDQKIVKANAAAGELFNCAPEDLIGVHQTELHSVGRRDRNTIPLYCWGGETEKAGNSISAPDYIMALDGREVSVETEAREIETRDTTYRLTSYKRRSEKYSEKMRLRNISSRLDSVIDSLPFPISVLNRDGEVELWNSAAEETFGYPDEAVVGEQYPLFVDEDKFTELFNRVLSGETIDGYETVHRDRRGKRVPVELYSRPIYEGNAVTGIIGTAIDLTARQHRDQQLEVLHRVLRHNVRNELTIIRGWTRSLVEDGADGGKTLDKIERASDRLMDLSDDAQRIRSGMGGNGQKSTPMPLPEALAEIESQVDASKDTALEVSNRPQSGVISLQGSQAITELLSNVCGHVGDANLSLDLRVHPRHVRFHLRAPGPVLPEGVRMFINTGEETVLKHGSDLSVAKSYLMLNSLGGTVSTGPVEDSDGEHELTIELPRIDIDN